MDPKTIDQTVASVRELTPEEIGYRARRHAEIEQGRALCSQLEVVRQKLTMPEFPNDSKRAAATRIREAIFWINFDLESDQP